MLRHVLTTTSKWSNWSRTWGTTTSHIYVLLLSSAIRLIVSMTLPSWFPVLVLKLPNTSRSAPILLSALHDTTLPLLRVMWNNECGDESKRQERKVEEGGRGRGRGSGGDETRREKWAVGGAPIRGGGSIPAETVRKRAGHDGTGGHLYPVPPANVLWLVRSLPHSPYPWGFRALPGRHLHPPLPPPCGCTPSRYLSGERKPASYAHYLPPEETHSRPWVTLYPTPEVLPPPPSSTHSTHPPPEKIPLQCKIPLREDTSSLLKNLHPNPRGKTLAHLRTLYPPSPEKRHFLTLGHFSPLLRCHSFSLHPTPEERQFLN